jgi:DNA-binding GntR family transcriptional regulator
VDDTGRDYLPVRSQILSRAAVTKAGPWTAVLGEGRVLMIERLMHIGDEFRLVSRIYVRPDVLPVFEDLPVRKLDGENFKDVIWRHTGQAIGAVQQFLSARRLPDDVARHVGVKRGTTGNHLEAFAWSAGGTPLYFQEFFIPPNGRRMHLPASGRDPGLLARSP